MALYEQLRSNPKAIIDYLTVAFNDPDTALFWEALQYVIDSQVKER